MGIAQVALGALFPSRCGLCGLLGERPICQICHASFAAADPGWTTPKWRGALDGVARLYLYEGRAEQAVRRLKYSRATSLGEPMAHLLSEFVGELSLEETDLVVPVPIHWTRRYFRGFNQSEMLCEALPGVDNRLLNRVRATRPQVGLNPHERRRNLVDAFRCFGDVQGRSLLLVDDVITTGHTVGECARTLKEAGAQTVRAVAFCGSRE